MLIIAHGKFCSIFILLWLIRLYENYYYIIAGLILLCVILCGYQKHKGVILMAKLTVEEIYYGNGYNVMSNAVADMIRHGRPKQYDTQTWMELLIVKHTLLAAKKMKIEGDSISKMFDGESSSTYVTWDEED